MILRDQVRARHAYECVADVPTDALPEYKVAVHSLAANVMRVGLSGAMAWLERKDRTANRLLLDHLASSGLLGVAMAGNQFPAHVRSLEADDYMLLTRELLAVASWFRRAVKAQGFGDA